MLGKSLLDLVYRKKRLTKEYQIYLMRKQKNRNETLLREMTQDLSLELKMYVINLNSSNYLRSLIHALLSKFQRYYLDRRLQLSWAGQ